MTIERVRLLGREVIVMLPEDLQALMAKQPADSQQEVVCRGDAFGIFCRLARSYESISQITLAKRCGWSQPFHSAVERGEYPISLEQVGILFKALGTDAMPPTPGQLTRLLKGEITPRLLLHEMGIKPRFFPSAGGSLIKIGDKVYADDRRVGQVIGLWPQSTSLKEAFDEAHWQGWFGEKKEDERAKLPTAILDYGEGSFQAIPSRYLFHVPASE